MNSADVILLDDMRLADAAALAIKTARPLVIDRDGHAKLVPQVLPGMVRIATVDKQLAAA